MQEKMRLKRCGAQWSMPFKANAIDLLMYIGWTTRRMWASSETTILKAQVDDSVALKQNIGRKREMKVAIRIILVKGLRLNFKTSYGGSRMVEPGGARAFIDFIKIPTLITIAESVHEHMHVNLGPNGQPLHAQGRTMSELQRLPKTFFPQ
ncbi:hypothetical protein VNO77_19435 [Canavalia gladiata]|uniref:Uncharacterized protein n=1 Tax=Canavalia gladiata TaxID=3824 RepID=A0AAN9LRB6_CANGL